MKLIITLIATFFIIFDASEAEASVYRYRAQQLVESCDSTHKETYNESFCKGFIIGVYQASLIERSFNIGCVPTRAVPDGLINNFLYFMKKWPERGQESAATIVQSSFGRYCVVYD